MEPAVQPPSPAPMSAELLEDLEIVTEWLNQLLGSDLDSERLGEQLQDGVILCQLTSSLSSYARVAGASKPPPIGIKRYHKTSRPGSIQARDNVSSFCLWCVLYEVPPVLILSPDNVVTGRNLRGVVSLLLFLVRKSSVFTISRKSSTSSTRSLYDRINRRSFSRGKSFDCFSDVVSSRSTSRTSIRTNDLFRTRSQSVDSEGSIGSTGSNRSPTFGCNTRTRTDETVDLIRELNLACRNISKKVVVASMEIPGYTKDDELCIDKCLEKESQSSLRRKNRLFLKSNSTTKLDPNSGNLAGKRRFVNNESDPLNISLEKLSLEDIEYLLLSTNDTIITKLQAVYKLLALRALESQSISVAKRGMFHDPATDITNKVYHGYNFRMHTSLNEKAVAFKALRSFLISCVSDNKVVLFGGVYSVWNKRYASLSP